MTSTRKPTTCKDAIKHWEEVNGGVNAATAIEVILDFQWPPIERMDNSLAMLTQCKRLSLSTNMIEKIAGVSSLKNLRILSLGRNQIKSFSSLEVLGDTLEELWISYNAIEKTKGVTALHNLRVLYISNNFIREWSEFGRFQELTKLRDLVFAGNPLIDTLEADVWRMEVAKRLPNLDKLDGEHLVDSTSEEVIQVPLNDALAQGME